MLTLCILIKTGFVLKKVLKRISFTALPTARGRSTADVAAVFAHSIRAETQVCSIPLWFLRLSMETGKDSYEGAGTQAACILRFVT